MSELPGPEIFLVDTKLKMCNGAPLPFDASNVQHLCSLGPNPQLGREAADLCPPTHGNSHTSKISISLDRAAGSSVWIQESRHFGSFSLVLLKAPASAGLLVHKERSCFENKGSSRTNALGDSSLSAVANTNERS